MLSSRFATPVVVLLALSAIPTVIHSYMDSTYDDGRRVREIPLRLAGETGVSTNRRAGWGEDRLASTDWIERTYTAGTPVKLVVARSYDLKKLYHHPELAVDYGQAYASHEVVTLAKRPEVPVHVLRAGDAGRGRIALYALEYEGSYVPDPIRFQLRTSLELLFSRRAPMTLFFAAQDLPDDAPIEGSRAAAVLLAALESFESQGRK